MGERSTIEWTDHTWSPWEGCQKTGSPACEHCYAEARNARFGGGEPPNWGPHAPRRLTSDSGWAKPWAWDRIAGKRGVRERVFPSLCDPFDNKAPDGARARFGNLILGTPNLDWLLLTKRIGNAAAMMEEMFGGPPPSNVWLGATVVTQEEADRDVPKLLATPATLRFLSMEPLLGPVDLEQAWHGENALSAECWGNCAWCRKGYPRLWNCQRAHGAQYEAGAKWRSGLDWIIVGGESGPGARPMHPNWARSLRNQCAVAGVPFLFKQWGEWASAKGLPGHMPIGHVFDDGYQMVRLGKKAAGRLLDGVTHDGVPG